MQAIRWALPALGLLLSSYGSAQAAGYVLGVQDTTGAVPSLTSQVVGFTAGGELYSPFDQIADRLRPFLDHHPDDILMADAGPGN